VTAEELPSADDPSGARPGRRLLVWGAKGHARVLAEFAPALGHSIALLVDNDPARESPIDGVPVVHGIQGLDDWLMTHPGEIDGFAVAIGGDRGQDRLQLHALLEERGLPAITLVHPASYVATDARVGMGSQVLAMACIGAGAVLGRQCIVNTSSSVDHECVLGDGAHIGPGATLAGCVRVGEEAFVGTGAVILPNVEIGRGATVGAGAVVTHDVEPGTIVTGVPARPISASDGVGRP
jgi:sugar O-acyltransferase (sialic acid O-acetyltransferase NeuD family)